ncbi:NAD(P)-binding protein [Hypoxylon sp. FL0543]|nr:NAD(P)-binding protein [Hypoxylon sp. FL0543]
MIPAQPRTTVIANVRDSESISSKILAGLPKDVDGKLIVAKIDSTPDTDAKRAIAHIKLSENMSHLDIVDANAQLIDVNALGPLRLAQATLPLLAKSPSRPRFVLLGSMQGSTGGMAKYPLPTGAYGASQAAAHFLVRKLHFEHPKEGICIFAVDPGCQEMGNGGAKIFGLDEAVIKVDEPVNLVVDQIDSATRETTYGRFPCINGGETEW